jgi:uncharacterized RDD family membrane protein YckC
MSTTPPPPPPPPGDAPPPPPPPPPPSLGDASGGHGPTAPDGRPIAEAWRRILARFLDGVIIGVAISQIVYLAVVGEQVDFTGNADDVPYGRILLASLVMLAVGFLWEAVLTKAKGGTPMKLAFGMRVVRADDGRDITWSQSVMRWGTVAIWSVIPILSLFVPLVLVIVSLVFIFTKPLRQAVWDRVAKTVVVKVR